MYQNPITAFPVGTEIKLGPKTATTEEIIEFAAEFDPAYFHLDEEAAKNSFLGSLTASGFHMCSLAMRMMCDAYITKSTSQGAPGVDEVKWLSPLRPGDTIHGISKVLESRRSKSRPNLMIIKFQFDFWNQNDEPVMQISNSAMFTIPADAIT